MRQAVVTLLVAAAPTGAVIRAPLLDETPASSEWDLASPLALRLPCRDADGRRLAAALLAERLMAATPLLERAEVAGPGFVNLRWSDTAWVDVLREVAESRSPAVGRTSWPAAWRRAWDRGCGLERMAARERPGVVGEAAFSLEAVPAGEPRRLVRQVLRHLEALLAIDSSRLAAASPRMEEMIRVFDRLYERHPLLRWPPGALGTACRVAEGVAAAVAGGGGRILARNV